MSRKQRRADKSTKAANVFVQLFNSALEMQQSGNLDGAAAAYRKAMGLNPNVPLLYNNYGVVLYEQRKYEEAVATHRKAVALDPMLGMAHNNMGVALNAMGRHEEALVAFSKAIEIQPTNYQAINNYGDSSVKLSLFAQGEAALRRALALQPDYVEALTNLGAALWGLGRLDEAVALFRRAIARQPDIAMAHKNLGIVSLLKGSYAEGWREYDWRWLADKIPLRSHPKPLWQGQPLGDGRLFIWSEQGVGDEILHASMMTDLAARGLNVLWECDPRLVDLLQRSAPSVQVVARAVPPNPITYSPAVAAHLPTGSLGNFLRADISAFPQDRRRYLVADPARTAAFRQRLAVAPGEKLVGISWLSKNAAFGVSKSTTLTQWADILRTPGAKFIDLQYGDTSEERAALARDFGITLPHVEGLDLKDDLDGVAALTAACDLVITVSNTTAHIAAALGIPTWILIASGIGKFWYWGFDAPTVPWYPTARLVRQQEGESWERPLRVMAKGLQEVLKSGRPPEIS